MTNLLSIATVIAFITFLGIVWWTMDKRRDKDFHEAANLPFSLPDDLVQATRSKK